MDTENLQLLLLTLFGICGFFLFVVLIAFVDLDKLRLISNSKSQGLQQAEGTSVQLSDRSHGANEEEEEAEAEAEEEEEEEESGHDDEGEHCYWTHPHMHKERALVGEDEPPSNSTTIHNVFEHIPFHTLKVATSHFSRCRLVHEGPSAAIYLGSLQGKLVAIKRFKPASHISSSSDHSLDPFFNELHVYASIFAHPHASSAHTLSCPHLTAHLSVDHLATLPLIQVPSYNYCYQLNHPSILQHYIRPTNSFGLPPPDLDLATDCGHKSPPKTNQHDVSCNDVENPAHCSIAHPSLSSTDDDDDAGQSVHSSTPSSSSSSFNSCSHPHYGPLNIYATQPSSPLNYPTTLPSSNYPTTLPSSTLPLFLHNDFQESLLAPSYDAQYDTRGLDLSSSQCSFNTDVGHQFTYSSSSSSYGTIPTLLGASSCHSLHQRHSSSLCNCYPAHSFLSYHYGMQQPHQYVPNHSYILPLLGYSLEEQERLIVYEYAPHRDLATALTMSASIWKAMHDKDACVQNNITCSLHSLVLMPWITRLKIANQVAEAMAFLHCTCQPPILHRCLKARNILLTRNFDVRLGGLKEASILQEGESPTFDIQCFGELLLQLLFGLDTDKQTFKTCLANHIDIQKLIEITDPSMMIDECLAKEVLGVAILAKACLDEKSLQNMSMYTISCFLKDPTKLLTMPFSSDGQKNVVFGY